MSDDPPAATPGAPSAAADTAVVIAPRTPRRPRRTRWVVLGAVGLLLLVAAGCVWLWVSGRAPVPVLDDAARAEATQRIQHEVASRLGIEPSDVAVDLGPAPILPQLERRVLDEATVVIDLPAARATELLAGAVGLDPAALSLGDGTVRLEMQLDAVVTTVSLGIGFAVTVDGGELVLAPAEFLLAGAPIALADVLEVPFVGDVVRPLTEPRAFCVASLLPASLALADVAVTRPGIVLTIVGEDIPLEAAALGTTGRC